MKLDEEILFLLNLEASAGRVCTIAGIVNATVHLRWKVVNELRRLIKANRVKVIQDEEGHKYYTV